MNPASELLDRLPSLLRPQPPHISLLIALAVFALTLLLGRGGLVRGIVRRRVLADISSADSGLDSDEAKERSWLMAQAAKFLAPSGRSTDPLLKKQLIQAGYLSDF